MNWDAIGAIGEIIGALAVILSLLYLALQIKNQNRESKFAAMHEISVGFRDAISKFSDESMASIIVKANSNYEDLSDDEAMRLLILSGQFFRAFEEAFIQYQEGRLDDRNWKAIKKYYINIMSANALRNIWEIRKEFLDDEFVKFVDNQSFHDYKIR